MMAGDCLDELQRAIKEYDAGLAITAACAAVEQNVPPNRIFKAMTVAIREVGDRFSAGELWLPDLMGASDTMAKATPIVEEALMKTGSQRESLGNIIIGTVKGDIHNTGKNMVTLLLSAEGFAVHDLGVDVGMERFVQAVHEYRAEMLCLSALMTTTVTGMKDVIDSLKETGIRDRIKIMVGGAPVTQQYADSIGADGYDPTAPGAAKLARILLGR
jgi:5-methyltetrahydrofolate--homocysteine methyltransferase